MEKDLVVSVQHYNLAFQYTTTMKKNLLEKMKLLYTVEFLKSGLSDSTYIDELVDLLTDYGNTKDVKIYDIFIEKITSKKSYSI